MGEVVSLIVSSSTAWAWFLLVGCIAVIVNFVLFIRDGLRAGTRRNGGSAPKN